MNASLVQTPLGTIHCPQKGLGDPILLVHGIYPGASRHEWDHNIGPLASNFQVNAPDLLGFGESDAPHRTFTVQLYHHLLRDLIATHIGKPTIVVAAGVSCAAAVRLAVYDDQLVSKLVLVAPTERPHEMPSVAERFTQFVYGTLAMGGGIYESVNEPSAIREYLEDQYADVKRIPKDAVKKLKYESERPNALYPFISLVTGFYNLDVYRPLRYVRKPTLLVWGDAADVPPADEVLAPAAWSQGKRIEIIEGAKLWPHVEQSAKFNDTVRAFGME
ncbi:MAG: alpha/beta fold hydrolase [Tepidisphaeraceae bacterium]